MKKTNYIILNVLLIMLLVGCEAATGIDDNNIIPEDIPISFTAAGTRSGGEPIDYKNLEEVPGTVGVFMRKDTDFKMENVIFQKTNYESDNYLDNDSVTNMEAGDPIPSGERLFWYKTSHIAAYWGKTPLGDPPAVFDFYAYAPVIEDGGDEYYTIDSDGVITFKIDEKLGLPVDFIYAKSEGATNDKADTLHLPFRHMFSKLAFKLRNSTENTIVCYGVRYEINYPTATFALKSGKWDFAGPNVRSVVERYAQYEIFSNTDIDLPNLTTLLFPVNTDPINMVTPVTNAVVVKFEVCLNNKWYNMSDKLANLNLQYTEGLLIELTFDCKLEYGDVVDGELWNIFVATFDSFEDGGVIDGILK